MAKTLPRMSLAAYQRIVETDMMEVLTMHECMELFGVGRDAIRNAIVTNALPSRKLLLPNHPYHVEVVHRATAAKLWGKKRGKSVDGQLQVQQSGQLSFEDIPSSRSNNSEGNKARS